MPKTKEKFIKDAIDPEVIVGSHLTVRKYANGRTELEWDDAALTRDVEAALASVAKPSTKKVTKAVKEVVAKIEKTSKPAKKTTTSKSKKTK